jgi:phosphatidylglycerol:prolipoprotein diacylglycerol transferase
MIAFTIFGLDIHWYGIMIATGILAAYLVCSYLIKKRNFNPDIPFELLILLVPIAILGARLYYIIFSGEGLGNFFNFENGIQGLAIYGGVIGGALMLLVYSLFIRRSSFFALTDILVIGLILAQAIGRWGNFFNQELYGAEVGFSFFPITVAVSGSNYLALFFYESFLNFIGFFVLLKIFSKQKNIGVTSSVYLIYYGLVRAVLEPLRQGVFILFFLGIPVSVLVSIAIVLVGIVFLILAKKRKLPQGYEKLLMKEKKNV